MTGLRNLCRGLVQAAPALAAGAMDRLDAAMGLARDRREDGGATVEFVIVLPVFLLIFFTSFEASMLLTRQTMLERGIDLAVREIRLDTKSTVSAAQMKETVCNRARILPDCEEDDNLLIELRVVENVAAFTRPPNDYPCGRLNTTITPPAPFQGERASKMVIVRACYAVEPFLPGAPFSARLVDDVDGAYRMVAGAFFVVEPADKAPDIPGT
ncbi:MAG: TadE family protein [Pseudomonadota bacterium]